MNLEAAAEPRSPQEFALYISVRDVLGHLFLWVPASFMTVWEAYDSTGRKGEWDGTTLTWL